MLDIFIKAIPKGFFFVCVDNLCVVCLFICFVKIVFLMPLTSVDDFCLSMTVELESDYVHRI